MTREEAKELLPIIQAWTEGKEIQYRTCPDKWVDIEENERVNFTSSPSDYRIKPELKYRPFKTKEECWDEMMKHQPFGWVKEISSEMPCLINAITNKNIVIMEDISSFKKALNIYEFKDGTPFGIKEESNEQ